MPSTKKNFDAGPEGWIGDRIAQERGKKEWSRSELSRQSGVSLSSLNMYEQKERMPGAREIRKLADSLEVSTDYLIYGEDNNFGLTDPVTASMFFDGMEDEALTFAVQLLLMHLKKEDRQAYARILFLAVASRKPPDLLMILRKFAMDWGPTLYDRMTDGDPDGVRGLLSDELPKTAEKIADKMVADLEIVLEKIQKSTDQAIDLSKRLDKIEAHESKLKNPDRNKK